MRIKLQNEPDMWEGEEVYGLWIVDGTPFSVRDSHPSWIKKHFPLIDQEKKRIDPHIELPISFFKKYPELIRVNFDEPKVISLTTKQSSNQLDEALLEILNRRPTIQKIIAEFANEYYIWDVEEFLDKGSIKLQKKKKASSKLLRSLQMTSNIEDVWYHGRSSTNTEFDYKYINPEGLMQEGPGFYFTNSIQDAKSYVYPRGIIITAKLDLKPVKGKVKPDEVDFLIDNAPDLEYTLSNWDENPKKARSLLKEHILNQGSAREAFQQVWVELYRREEEQYLRNLIKLGYTGHMAPSMERVVMYDPKAIKVVDATPVEGKLVQALRLLANN